jgi:hypothetical protein
MNAAAQSDLVPGAIAFLPSMTRRILITVLAGAALALTNAATLAVFRVDVYPFRSVWFAVLAIAVPCAVTMSVWWLIVSRPTRQSFVLWGVTAGIVSYFLSWAACCFTETIVYEAITAGYPRFPSWRFLSEYTTDLVSRVLPFWVASAAMMGWVQSRLIKTHSPNKGLD